jgi:hypothetical protein
MQPRANHVARAKKIDSMHLTHKNREMWAPVCDVWSHRIHAVCPSETFQLTFKH